MDVVKHSDLKPASFGNGLIKADIQVYLVVKLLKMAIEENRPIVRKDIIDCYLDFLFYGNETIYRPSLWRGKCKRQDGFFDRGEIEEFQSYLKQPAFDWFKKHLGSAILKGKLVVIPIIEIEN